MIPFTIDGQPVEGKEDGNVLEVALDVGIEIPHLCYNESVKPYGACRLCLVEVARKGRSRMTTSCTYLSRKGLKSSPRAKKFLEPVE
jgi:NADH dehydrogenase/NADH:ubiquinone oxidoreductase subunit G